MNIFLLTLGFLLSIHQASALVIPTISHEYCLNYGKTTEEAMIHMAETLFDFSTYKTFDGSGASYPITVGPVTLHLTPFDLIISKEIPGVRTQNDATDYGPLNASTSAVFGIQPIPKQGTVDAQYYPQLKLDCTTVLSKEFESHNFQYVCSLDTTFKHNNGLERFDTTMVANDHS